MDETILSKDYCYGKFKKIDNNIWVQQKVLNYYTRVGVGTVIVTLQEEYLYPMLTSLKEGGVNVKTVVCGQEKNEINNKEAKLTVLLRQSNVEWPKYLTNKSTDLDNILEGDDCVVLTHDAIKNYVAKELGYAGATIHELNALNISPQNINKLVSDNHDKWNVILTTYRSLPPEYPPSANSWELHSTGAENYKLPYSRGSYRVITDKYNIYRMKDIDSRKTYNNQWPRQMSLGRKYLLDSLGIKHPLRIYNHVTSKLEDYIPDKVKLYGAISHRWLGSVTKYDKWEDMLQHANKVYNRCKTHFRKKSIELPELNKWWLDTTCIDQRNLSEKMQEIPKMARVYRESSFVVAVLDDIDINVFNELSVKIRNTHILHDVYVALFSLIISSQWWKRGWTLQEWMLAMNIIFIVPGSDEWITNDDFEESVIRSHTSLNISKQVYYRRLLPHSPFLLYSDVIDMMSNRDVGIESDRVYCTSGISFIAMTSSGHTPYDIQICSQMAALLEGDLDILKNILTIKVEGSNWASIMQFNIRAKINILKAKFLFCRDGFMQIIDARISKIDTIENVDNRAKLGINTLLTYVSDKWDNIMEAKKENEEHVDLSEYDAKLMIITAHKQEFCCIVTERVFDKQIWIVEMTTCDEQSDKLRYICIQHTYDVFYRIGTIVSGPKVHITSDMVATIKLG